MSFRKNLSRPVHVALFILAVGCTRQTARAGGPSDYQAFVNKTAPALVTVKFVLKVQGSGGQRDIEREFTAVMIGPRGMVLCSSVQLGTSKLMRRFGGTATPTDIKVLIGEDTEGVDAKLLASDSDLDLSWLQIKEPREKGYVFVDFANSGTVPVGGALLTINRMDKFFDRAPLLNVGRLGGKTRKPRELLLPSSGLDVTPGMPIFAEDCSTVGVVVIQSPDPEDTAANPGMAGQSTAALILPSADVMKATKQARETALESEEDDEGETESAQPSATSKPAGQGAGDESATGLSTPE